MGNLSTYIQKCMYPILDKPFLELILTSVITNKSFNKNSDTIILVVGHLQNQIKSYFTEKWNGININYVTQEQNLGTAHAIVTGISISKENDDYIIIQGDVWVEPEYIAKIVESKNKNIISIIKHKCNIIHNERVDINNNIITKAWMGSGKYIDCGVWKFSKEVLDFMMCKKTDEYRALISIQKAIDSGIIINAIKRKKWFHLGGTEPSSKENIKKLLIQLIKVGAI